MERKKFDRLLNTVAEHNNYGDARTVAECDAISRWTPVDLICREYLNNGGGSAKGFLGISPRDCAECYDFIQEHIEDFIAQDMINETACNNSGFPLWNNYCRNRR